MLLNLNFKRIRSFGVGTISYLVLIFRVTKSYNNFGTILPWAATPREKFIRWFQNLFYIVILEKAIALKSRMRYNIVPTSKLILISLKFKFNSICITENDSIFKVYKTCPI